MQFAVEPAVFSALPDVCFGVVVAKGIDNTRSYPAIDVLLQEGVAAAEARFSNNKVKEDPAILLYREAFLKLSINPNKFMSSIEALFTRVSKGKGLPSINPIVDLGNAFSLRYTLPMGAHDIGQMEADITIRFSRANDNFLPFGEEETEIMPEDELVYAAGSRIRTRRWIWRQSEIGKIVPESRDIFFPIDGFSGNRDIVLAARDALSAACAEIFQCEVHTGLVDSSNPILSL